jgi:hypothetical protein
LHIDGVATRSVDVVTAGQLVLVAIIRRCATGFSDIVERILACGVIVEVLRAAPLAPRPNERMPSPRGLTSTCAIERSTHPNSSSSLVTVEVMT